MPSFTVRQGKRYRAQLALNFVERFASNETIAKKFREVGFSEVRVSGSGRTRDVEGVWPGENANANMPPQIRTVSEIA